MKLHSLPTKKRILYSIGCLILVLSPIIIFLGYGYIDIHNDPDSHEPWVSFFNDPHQRVYVSWETEEQYLGIVHYGFEEGNLNETSNELFNSTIHHVILTSLIPNTQYFYKVEQNSNGELSRLGRFKTAPNSTTEDFSWVMASDTQQPNFWAGHHYKIASILKKNVENGKEYAFLNIIGDHVEDGREKHLWNNYFSIVNKYGDSLPLAPVVGNHDRIWYPEDTYFDDYYIQSVSPSDQQFVWSYDWGNVHFTILNIYYGHANEITEQQVEWAKSDLESAQNATFRVVMFHCPIVGAGFFGRNPGLLGEDPDIPDNMTQILHDYNVSALIHGHEHHYERGEIAGMKYFILGGGGGLLDPGLRPQQETEFINVSPSYTEVHATSDSLTFQTYSIDGTKVDECVLKDTEVL